MAWSKNGTTTLSSAGDSVTVSSLTASEFGVILQSNFNSGSINCTTRLNSDSGSNYSSRWSLDGASDSTFTSQASILQTTGTDTPNFALSYIINISSEEKLMIGNLIKQNTAGASTAPSRSEFVGKWANTSNSISTISTENTSTGDYDTDSNLTVLNGDTTEEIILANVQSGSRFEATDTRKIYYGVLPLTFEDDFSGADNWTDSGSILGVNTGTDVIDFESATSNNVKEQTTYDLTSTSDTKWVLRCKLNVTTFTQPTVEYHRFFVGLSSSTSNLNTAEDAIGLKYELGASSFNQLVAIDTDGTTIRATTGDNFTHTSAVETLYVEIIRQSATTYDVYLRSGSHSGSLVESKTGLTVSASTNSLRYIKIASYSDNAGNGELSGTVDDIQFYNGVTSPDFAWTEEV